MIVHYVSKPMRLNSQPSTPKLKSTASENLLVKSARGMSATCAKLYVSVLKRPSKDETMRRPIALKLLKRIVVKLSTIKHITQVQDKKQDAILRSQRSVALQLSDLLASARCASQCSQVADDTLKLLKSDFDRLTSLILWITAQANSGLLVQRDIKVNALSDLNPLREIGDLRGFASKVFSQNGEDGILQEIFRRIKTKSKFFVEFGVEDGGQCNTRYLAECCGWSGLYFEASDAHYAGLKKRWEDNSKIHTINKAITSINFEDSLRDASVPEGFDLLVIDIDGNDYWVWKSLVKWRPRVVVIEYNAFHAPPRLWVMEENLNHSWDQTTYFGASFASLHRLGKEKGYRLVEADPMGVNMFFVREDCMTDEFIDPSLFYFFQPFGYLRPPSKDGPHCQA